MISCKICSCFGAKYNAADIITILKMFKIKITKLPNKAYQTVLFIGPEKPIKNAVKSIITLIELHPSIILTTGFWLINKTIDGSVGWFCTLVGNLKRLRVWLDISETAQVT